MTVCGSLISAWSTAQEFSIKKIELDGEDINVHVVPLAALPDFLVRQRALGLVIDCRLVLALGLV